MARIRTIKPEICTSTQFVECSTNARLLFVLMLCFFDDGGNHPANAKRLKMEVFPADCFTACEIQALMDELITHGLVVTYTAENEEYWHITGFLKHQKIDRPNPKYPEFDESSTKVRRKFDDQSPPEGKGKEGKGIIKKPAMSETETQIRNCIADRQAFIQKQFPHVNIEIETEELVAKYRDKTIGADPWLIISRWFKNIPATGQQARSSPEDEQQVLTAQQKEAVRKGEERIRLEIEAMNRECGVYATA